MLGVRPTFPCGGRTCRRRGRRRPGRCRWRCGGRSRERRKHRSGRQFSERPENMPRKPAFALIHTKPALPASIHSGHVHIIGSLLGGVFRRFREHYYITGLTPFLLYYGSDPFSASIHSGYVHIIGSLLGSMGWFPGHSERIIPQRRFQLPRKGGYGRISARKTA